jgi:protein-S-isoprenylcysteine O-methyltransferase Ste14
MISSPDLALVLYALFFALALGLRILLHLRRTGSTGFRGISGRPGSAEWVGGVLFVVALALGVAGCLLQRAGLAPPVDLFDRSEVRTAGIVLFAVGIAATLAAQLAMGASWRIGVDASERTALVTSGPFRLVRNPIFSAMLIAVAGASLIVPNAAALCAAALFLIAIEIQVRLVEEPYLIRTHGADYLAFAARVGRFLPLLGRLRGDRA